MRRSYVAPPHCFVQYQELNQAAIFTCQSEGSACQHAISDALQPTRPGDMRTWAGNRFAFTSRHNVACESEVTLSTSASRRYLSSPSTSHSPRSSERYLQLGAACCIFYACQALVTCRRWCSDRVVLFVRFANGLFGVRLSCRLLQCFRFSPRIVRMCKSSYRRRADAVAAHMHLLGLGERLAVGAVADDVVGREALGLVQLGRL